MQALSNLDHDVKRFNELIRNASTSQGASTRWHFDLRFSTLQPPGHLLWLFNFTSKMAYAQSLPLHNIDKPSKSISWFPELGTEAAPDTAYALVYFFVQLHKTKSLIPAKIFTDDQPLAIEVGKELRRIGIADTFSKIGTTTSSGLSAVHAAFEEYFRDLPGNRLGLITAPQGISFFIPPPQAKKWTRDGNELNQEIVCEVANRFMNATPEDSSQPNDVEKVSTDFLQYVDAIEARFEQSIDKTTTLVECDDAEGTIYYALRLWYGIGVLQNRSECRKYLCKALFHCPAVTNSQKILACTLLMHWHLDDSSDSIRSRDLNAAAHFADTAAALTPKGKLIPAILHFGLRELGPLTVRMPELELQYQYLWCVVRDRQAEIVEERRKSEVKRLKAPLRYQCANQDCPIIADSGHMLQRCAGRCDADKKPSYSKIRFNQHPLQDHKPYCRSGAECSVLEKTHVFPQTKAAGRGSVGVPLTLPDGRQTIFATSTIDVEIIKKLEKSMREKE
ncbi:hypothetical protein DL96DRAFT_1457543 [Flagelloscypha sp. PMI_526]|nr:hypothetical protein DL96DRAFT_1457543 [Flagelloscypha sp. PMI_526]